MANKDTYMEEDLDIDKEGKVLSVNVKDHTVLVEGINMVTKHMKPGQVNPQGGIVEKEAPIDISNVMYCVNGQSVRIGFGVVNGKKVRINKKTGEPIA